LFFSGRGLPGTCPAGGGHDASQSGDYSLGSGQAPSAPPTVKTQTWAFYLTQQQVWQGVIPYYGVFGQGINGHLLSLTNPGANYFSPGEISLVTPSGGTINLAAGASTSSADLIALYGTTSPPLPVGITGIVYTGVFNSIRIDVTYSYQ